MGQENQVKEIFWWMSNRITRYYFLKTKQYALNFYPVQTKFFYYDDEYLKY